MADYKKQVRFAYNLHTFHSPSVPTLPLAPSHSSPTTPPSKSHGIPRPPYNTPYLSPSIPRPHSLLDAAAVSWDLMDHLPFIAINNTLLSERALYEQATVPSLPYLSITSIYLPWIFDVYASNGSYVTLGDVFNSIHQSLRINITTAEFNSFPQRDQASATRFYEQRYRRFRNTFGHDEEKRGGMKRIDFLMGHTRFHGLSNSGHQPDQWQLNVLPLDN